MARIRNDGTILLNGLQMATFQELKNQATPDGVISRDVAAGYKLNVINSLVRHGAIKEFRKFHYKLVANAVVIDEPVRKSRTANEDVVSDEMVAA
jgi:hypothetical protein